LQGTANVKKQQLKVALLTSLGTALAISALRFVGILQPVELPAFDLTMRSRPSELKKDLNILVIEVTKEDKKIQQNSIRQSASSLSDEYLNLLLKKLIPLEPRIIGIDNYLNHSIDPKYTAIHNSLQSGDLVAVCKTTGASRVRNSSEPENEPPKDASKFGFGDTIADPDDISRRHLLATNSEQPGASCNSPWALSTRLAYEYLYLDPQEIQLHIDDHAIQIAKNVKVGNREKHQLYKHSVLSKFSDRGSFLQYFAANTGGYQGFNFDDRGYQIPLNYRLFENSITKAIPSISLQQALDLPSDRLKQAVRDKLILIGTTDADHGDIVTTPYGKIPGVFHQAQMTSQLISAALDDNRPLFWATPFWVDSSIVLLCSTIGGLLVWTICDRHWLLLGLGSGIVVFLYGGSVALLTVSGYWFPLVPASLGLVITGICVKIYLSRATKVPPIASNSLSSLSYNNR
jgi:CHASE2 domain-containing sensor protein